jgi:CubicO group peptidase (beta-lactamase class C family)
MKLLSLLSFSLISLSSLPALTASAESNTPPSAESYFPSAAQQLDQLVATSVARDEMVGAEVFILHQGTTLLHRAYGWKNREGKHPMELDSLFAIRSMTKPLTGMAAQLLVDEGKLELDAPVSRYLASFDNDKSRSITIRHLLTHRSGLPVGFSAVMGKPLAEYSGLRELADESGATGPEFLPGSRFLYSDAGSDALGAIIAEVAGQSLETFIEERVLKPLSMAQTFSEERVGEAIFRDRITTRYAGMTGSWTPYWAPSDPPLYRFLKGSGGLLSTPRDYARFLEFWMQSGKTVHLLSAEAIERALSSATKDASTTGFAGAVADYGQMWMLIRDHQRSDKSIGFGHSGSDGTLAYAFPEQQLIVCLFTQSRGTVALRTFEQAISHLFLKPDAAAFARLLPSAEALALDDYLGLYGPENRAKSLGAMIRYKDRLAFELPSRQVMLLRATEDRDQWIPERAPNDLVAFHRTEGRVTGFTLTNRGRATEAKRFIPDPGIPSLDEVASLRNRALPRENVLRVLPLKLTLKGEMAGTVFASSMTMASDGSSYSEVDFGAKGKMRVWAAGDRAWRQLPGQTKPVELHGVERAEELSGSLAALIGDWRNHYRDIVVLGREAFEGSEVLRIRTAPAEGFASTKLVNVATGAVMVDYGISVPPGAGLMPVETRYSDFRLIEGLLLAHEYTVILPGGDANRVKMKVVNVEPRISMEPDTFVPPTN